MHLKSSGGVALLRVQLRRVARVRRVAHVRRVARGARRRRSRCARERNDRHEREGSEGSRTSRRRAAVRSPMRGRPAKTCLGLPRGEERGSSAQKYGSDRHWRARARCLAQRTGRAPCAKVRFCWRARGTREHARRGNGGAQGLPFSPMGRKDLRRIDANWHSNGEKTFRAVSAS